MPSLQDRALRVEEVRDSIALIPVTRYAREMGRRRTEIDGGSEEVVVELEEITEPYTRYWVNRIRLTLSP